MYTTVGRLSSYISQGVYTFSGPFHPFGGAVDIIVVQQQDGTFKSTPWYVKFGKFQGVLKRTEKIVAVAVNDVDANFHMYLDHKGEAYFLEDVSDTEKTVCSPPSGPSSGDEALEPLALEYHKTEVGEEGSKDQHDSGTKDESSDDGEDDVEETSKRWADEGSLQKTYSEELDKASSDSQLLSEDTWSASVSRTASKETSKIQEFLNEAVGIRDAGELGPATALIANSALISIERVAESGNSLHLENGAVNITENTSILEVYEAEKSEYSASHMAETSLSSETSDLGISTSDVAASVVADVVQETGKAEDVQIEISELEGQVLSAEMNSTQEAPLAIVDECSTSLQVQVSPEQEMAWTGVVIKAAAALQEAPTAYSPSKQSSNLKENAEKRTWGWWVWRGGGSNQPKQGSDGRVSLKDSKRTSIKESSVPAEEHIESSFEDPIESMVIPVQERNLERETPEIKSNKGLKPARSILGLMFGASGRERLVQDGRDGKDNKASSLESAESVVELLENKWTIGNGARIENSVKSMDRIGLIENQVDARNVEPLHGAKLEVNCVEVSQPEGSSVYWTSSSQAGINVNHKTRNGMTIPGNVDLSSAEVVLMSVDGHLVVAKQEDCSSREPKQSVMESSVGDDMSQSKEAFESYVSVSLEVKGGNIYDLESSGDKASASCDYGGHVVCKMQLQKRKEASSVHKKAQRYLLSFDDHNTVGIGGNRTGKVPDGDDDVFKSCSALPDLLSAASEDEEEQANSPKHVENEIIEPARKEGYGSGGDNANSATTAPINVPGKRFIEMTDAMDMKVGSESILDPPGHRTDFGRLSNSLSSYFHGKERKTSSSLDDSISSNIASRFPPSAGMDVEEAIEKASMDVQVGSPWSTVSVPGTTMIDIDSDMLKNEVSAVEERQTSASEAGTSEKTKNALLAGFELSLCRHLLTEGMGVQAAAQVFDANKISAELFRSSGSLVGNEALVVRVGGRYYPSAVAASILFGLLAFGQVIIPENGEPIKVEAPETVTDIISKPGADTSSGGWKFWPFALRRPKTPDVTQAVSQEALLVATQAALHNSLATGLIRRNGYYRRSWKNKVRTLIPTSQQLASLNLKEGRNKITFTFTTRVLGKQQVDARIYLWKWNTKIVISDVDGTITKSDVLGQVMPLVGKDWTQTGVTRLFSAIKDNGYQLMFLSARAISQAYLTRQFLVNLKQDGEPLPDGPVVISPDGLFPSLYREVIRRAPHEFKIACLEDIKSLFPSECQPFYAGFGNRDTDEISYLKVGIPKGKIFIINPKGEVIVNNILDLKSYTSLHKLVNDMFPPVAFTEREDFNSWNFWKMPLPDVDDL